MIGNQTPQLIGEDPSWLEAQEHVSRLAPLDRPCLIIGERGTGKELIGERMHFLSRRWEGPFVKVNCAALSEQLLDSELFGHERGAFTGATERRLGRFELADGGTLFLDEIATASKASLFPSLNVRIGLNSEKMSKALELNKNDYWLLGTPSIDLAYRTSLDSLSLDLTSNVYVFTPTVFGGFSIFEAYRIQEGQPTVIQARTST